MTNLSAIQKFKTYYSLTKPGIIRGNLMVATAGFLLASQNHINWLLLLAVLAGISLIIASACVFNNYIDRNIDKKMARTKQRALVKGRISYKNALVFASLLGIVGLYILVKYTNILTVWTGVIGFVDYVVVYGIAKRRSTLGTLVGSVSGSMPLVAGYVAVTNRVDSAAVLLFLIMVFWQMAHFFAIAIYRYDDYKTAGVPVLPVKKSIAAAKQQIIFYVLAFDAAVLLLNRLGYLGAVATTPIVLAGILWLVLGVKVLSSDDDKTWGKKMFLFSLIVITLFSIMLSTDAFLQQNLYAVSMLIVFHILSALTSVLLASYLLLRPTKRLFNATNTLTVTTVGSGTYLVISRHAALLSACIAGLVYLGLISTALFVAHLRLAKVKVDSIQ